MTLFNCPSCNAPNDVGVASCASCKNEFPWSAELEVLKNEIKEREVNRGKATFTLIDELFRAGKGGKPVSVSAIKGFAFAWLFPRTLIVAGSIATGLLVLAQVFILQRQTALMERQTLAMQVEHSERLRMRVSDFETYAKNARELSASFSKQEFAFTCLPGCGRLKVDQVFAYENLENYRYEKFGAVSKEFMSVINSLETIITGPIEAQIKSSSSADVSRSWQETIKMLDPAATACLLPAVERERLAASVRIVEKWAMPKSGLVDYDRVFNALVRSLADTPGSKDMSLFDLSTAIATGVRDIGDLSSNLADRCSSLSAHDNRVLKLLDDNL